MPIAKFEMPDGRIARFEVPDGTTPQEAQRLIEEHLGAAPAEPPKGDGGWIDRNIIAPLERGFGPAERAMVGETSATAPYRAAPLDKSAAFNRGYNMPGRELLAGLQGPTFSMGDNIIGAGNVALQNVRRAFGFGDPNGTARQDYEYGRDMVQGAVDRQQEDAPGTTMRDQILLSLPTGGPIGKGLAYVGGKVLAKAPVLRPAVDAVRSTGSRFLDAAPLTARATQAGGVGFAAGAANGLGDSRSTDLGDIGNDMLSQGTMGMAMGGFGVPFTRAIGAVGGNVMSRFSDSAASHYAQEKLAQAFARDAAHGVSDPLGQASRRLTRLGDEARLVDVGGQSGQNVKSTLDVLATLPGRTKTLTESAIHERQASRGPRMIKAAEDATGTGGVRMSSQIDDWTLQQATRASPLYERLYKMDVPANQELSSIVSAARNSGYDKAAAQIANDTRVPFTLPDESSALSGTYSMRDMDLLKQGMDNAIAKMYDPITGNLTTLGVGANKLRMALIKELDRSTMGQYAVARSAFAGPAQLKDVARLGKRMLSQDDASIRGAMAGYGSSERDAFALGAFEALRAKMGKDAGQTELTKLWRQTGLQEKLKAVFGDERSYREFAARMAAEGRMKGLESVGRGSQTAARQAAAGDLDTSALGAAGDMAGNAASGNAIGVMRGMSNMWSKAKTPEPVRDAMGQILLSRGPQAQQDLIGLQDAMRRVNEARRREARGLGIGLGSQSGNLLGLIN
jgi:hypothetical protein